MELICEKINNKRLEIISSVLITRRRCRVRPRRKFQLGGDKCDNGRCGVEEPGGALQLETELSHVESH